MEKQEVTAEALVDLPVPHDVRISPDGTKVVYSVSSIGKTGDHELSSLWIADVTKEHSARQLTSGLFNDVSPQWLPTQGGKETNLSTCIAFISDRAKVGESSAIYVIDLHGGEPYPITRAQNKKKIAAFKWSPRGDFIAFISPDETSSEQEAGDAESGDVKVYGKAWEYNRLRCVHVATREIETLYKDGVHVTDFAWKHDGTEIVIVTQATPEFDSAGYHGATFRRVNVLDKTSTVECRFPGLVKDLVWLASNDEFYFRAGYTPDKICTSNSVYRVGILDSSWSRLSYGTESCLTELRKNKSTLIGHVQHGLHDKIEPIDLLGELDASGYSTLGEIHTWDILPADYEPIRELTVAFAKSDCSSPAEMFYRKAHTEIQLSQHGSAIAKFEIGKGEPIYCKAKDGTQCDGIFIRPSRAADHPKPMPTVVLIHGGPYSRITIAFNLLYFYWVPYLVSAGYSVLCPNYRGGSSHGEEYAKQAAGAMGTKDYDDVISLLEEGIAQGLIDGSRVAIGGWSQGGFLSYLAVTRQNFHFKAAICGAGVADWDMLTMSSDAPWFESEIAGKAPWQTDVSDTSARHGSAIWHMKNIKTPILILHGEKDERVPLTQGVAFHRGCLHHGVPCEFVTYPREGHIIKERKHLVDMLKRIRRFCDMHLKE